MNIMMSLANKETGTTLLVVKVASRHQPLSNRVHTRTLPAGNQGVNTFRIHRNTLKECLTAPRHALPDMTKGLFYLTLQLKGQVY